MAKKIHFMCNGKKLEIKPLTNSLDGEISHKTSEVHAPGRGVFEVSDVMLLDSKISEGESLIFKAAILGKNISQISFEVMRQTGNIKIGPVQKDYLLAPKSREVRGVVRPHWEAENEIEFEVTPVERILCCGESFTLACMTPERYGVEPDMQIWSLEGIYQRGGGEPFRSKFEFDNHGALVRKTGFSPASVGGLVSPFELLIEDGDTFEPYVTLIDKKGEVRTGTVNPIMLGGGNLLHWQSIDACPGQYQIGLVIEDFDGQEVRVYSGFTIKDPQ